MQIQDVLRAWGRSKRVNEPPNGYPKSTPFSRFIINPGDMADRAEPVLPLTDDEHERVDRIISLMGQRKPEVYEIICRSYITHLMDHQIAKSLGYSRSSVRTMRLSGESWLEAKLDVYTDCVKIQAGCIDRC